MARAGRGFVNGMALLAVLLSSGCLRYQSVDHAELFPDRHLLEVDDGVLRYEEVRPRAEDPGSPVLFIHGFGSTLETWELVVPALSYDHHCVSVDMKGFGRSSKYEADYSVRGMAGSLVELLDLLDLEQVDVVAHSYGCAVALALALHFPDRVGRMVLTDAFAYSDQLPWYLAWARTPVVGEMLFGMFYAQQLDYRLALSFYDDNYVTHDMVRTSRDLLGLPGTRAAALAVVRGLDLERSQERYWSLQQRTLVVWGAQDQVTPLRYGHRLVQHLPDARLEQVHFAGHFPMVEAAGHYAQVVAEFLAEPAPEVGP